MGADQSSAKDEQRNSRNISRAEVDAALEKQRIIYETRMKELVQNQRVAGSQQSTSSTPRSVVQPATAATPARPPPPRLNIEAGVDANILERQRSPYNYTQNNLNQVVTSTQSPNSSRPLYPNLNFNGNASLSAGNNNYVSRQSPVRNSANDFVFVKSNFKAERFAPSAPPAPSSPPSRQRHRSVSRPRSSNETGINCPTCKNRFGVKIFNCESGHASCMNCRMKQRPCGLCGTLITQMRNISVEEYVLELKVPCVNVDEGCLLHFKLSEMEQHEKECPFKEIQCLLPGGRCLWNGKLSLLAAHFQNFHPLHKVEVGTEMFFEIPKTGETKLTYLIRIGNFNFVLNLLASTSKNKVYLAVHLLGTKVSATKWNYEIHVYDKGAPRRKYQYTDKCFSNADKFDDIVNDNICAVLPMYYAKTFANQGTIAYKFYIKKEFNANIETRRDFSGTRRGGRGGFRKF